MHHSFNAPMESIASRASNEDAHILSELIDNIALTAPKKGGFYFGNEADFLFIDRAGIALRIGYNESKDGMMDVTLPRDHDLIVLPWKQLSLSNCTLEICPIVDMGENRIEIDQEVAFLTDQLSLSGINFWDIGKPDNIAYLPAFKNEFSQGLPIVVDRGAVMDTQRGVALERPTGSQAAFYDGIQEKLYGKFKSILKQAWPDGTELKDSNKRLFSKFCEVCAENRNLPEGHDEKVLFGLKAIGNYDSSRNRSVEALRAANNYEEASQDAGYHAAPA